MTTVKPLPQDAITLAQSSRILSELRRLNPLLPYDEEGPWIAELNSRCNLNITDLDELTKREASKIINSLLNT